METEGQTTEEGAEKVENLTETVVDTTSSDTDKTPGKAEGALSDADQTKLTTIQSLLDEHDIESPEDLKDFVARLSNLNDKIGDTDLEELKSNSALLKRYQKAWAEEESRKLEENETPEETIDRLKAEKKQEREKLQQERREREIAQENKVLLKNFNSTVKKAIKAQKGIPDVYHDLLTEYLGVDNEINEINIDDKAAINRITKSAAKKIMAFEQDVIKRYLGGKAKVVKMTSTTDETPQPTKKVKDLKDARGVLKERLSKIFSK